MERLPIDLNNKIMSFLPINDEQVKKLLENIRRVLRVKNVKASYLNYWQNYSEYNDEGFDWLSNDISIWMNDKIPMFIEIKPKYKNYTSKIFDVPVCDIRTHHDINMIEKNNTSEKLSELYLYSFDDKDFESCLSFLGQNI